MSAEAAANRAVVFRGPIARCREFGLVLEARGIEHEVLAAGQDLCIMTVPASLAAGAYEELSRYIAESRIPRPIPHRPATFKGAALASVGYALVLVAVAYCAGAQAFGRDWVGVGALDAALPREAWRALTALTLHVEQEHLLGNLLFGMVAGTAVGRLLGPGFGWASILAAGILANLVEIWISPPVHRALGASTAVFAALGLLAGMAWRQQLSARERRWYAWAPLIAGVCLLTLLGAGAEHVDVLGHGLGFAAGLALGWVYARARIPRGRRLASQWIAGTAAVGAVFGAWALALTR